MSGTDLMKLKWDDVNNLFEYYNGKENDKFSNRYLFIEKALELYRNITCQEACLIWQAFDRAAEEWQKNR